MNQIKLVYFGHLTCFWDERVSYNSQIVFAISLSTSYAWKIIWTHGIIRALLKVNKI